MISGRVKPPPNSPSSSSSSSLLRIPRSSPSPLSFPATVAVAGRRPQAGRLPCTCIFSSPRPTPSLSARSLLPPPFAAPNSTPVSLSLFPAATPRHWTPGDAHRLPASPPVRGRTHFSADQPKTGEFNACTVRFKPSCLYKLNPCFNSLQFMLIVLEFCKNYKLGFWA